MGRTGMSRTGMGWALLAPLLLAPPLPGPGVAQAKPFECPRLGGAFVFGREIGAETLDLTAPAMAATRAVVMNIHESLMTRDEANRPIPDLAETVAESPDRLTYAFRLRSGVVFHNGKPMTAADVAASFDRYARVSESRDALEGVAGWEAPDPLTFLIRMRAPRPAFLDILSSFAVPVVVVPAEDRDVPAGGLNHPIGTGPFRVTGFTPGGPVVLARHDRHRPNPAFEERTGFGGRKLACLDAVTFRTVPDGNARAAALRAGELDAADDLPARVLPALAKDPAVVLLPVRHWWLAIALPNTSAPPTDGLAFRRAVQAALDMDEILEAASDGHYSLNVGFQYPDQAAHSDAGRETYNLRDPALARRLLVEAGYGGEPVVLLTDKEATPVYNAALAAQQQLQAVGINARLKVVDRATAERMADVSDDGWNLFFTRWGLQPALGPLATMRRFVGPNAAHRSPHDPGDGPGGDPDLLAAWAAMNAAPEERDRHAAFGRMQAIALERVYAIPFGGLARIQGTRAAVRGFAPFRVPRLSNVWIAGP